MESSGLLRIEVWSVAGCILVLWIIAGIYRNRAVLLIFTFPISVHNRVLQIALLILLRRGNNLCEH